MTDQDIDNINAIWRAGGHVGSGLGPVDYYFKYGTGDEHRLEEERAAGNRAVDAKRARAKEAKP